MPPRGHDAVCQKQACNEPFDVRERMAIDQQQIEAIAKTK
jgi:hypothetical protein